MHRWRASLVALVLLSACGSSDAHSSPSSAAHYLAASCGAAAARTLASDNAARVFASKGIVYGCSRSTGMTYRLGSATVCIGTPRVDHLALAGALVAYGRETCGVDTGSTQIVIRRLDDGRQVLSEPAISGTLGVESYESIGSIVLRADGSVAWIASGRSIVGHGTARTEVHAAGKEGLKLLDSGAGIAARSLRLKGTRLTWTRGGAIRSATLR